VAKKPEYITIGRFGRPRGVSGEIYIIPATDDTDRFLELSDIIAVGKGKRRELHLTSAAIIGGRPVVSIEGVRSREEAAQLTNLSLEIPFAQARPLPEGSYYQFDLVGCRVIGVDGTEYVVVEEVLFYPANDMYRITSDRFGEVLLPVIDKFVKSVDIEKEIIVIDPPGGLFEANRDDA
jgi:16S rRNA processing protein RimM